jgi:hypothetical protein
MAAQEILIERRGLIEFSGHMMLDRFFKQRFETQMAS